MRPLPTVLGSACFALLALSGCDVFDRSKVIRDAAVDSDCPLARPAPRPSGDGRGDEPTITFAMRNIVLDQRQRWSEIGYDLDGQCTSSAEDAECIGAMGEDDVEPDGPGGVDNALGHSALPLVLAAMPNLEDESRNNQRLGIGVLLVSVQGWNGRDDDARVDAQLAQSVFGTPALANGDPPSAEIPEGGVVYTGGGDPPLPAWEGDDYFFARDDSFHDRDLDRPLVRDDNAYVSNGTLVMQLPDRFPISFVGPTMGIRFLLTDAKLTVAFSEDRTLVTRAILAGRWGVVDALDAGTTAGICPDTLLYENYRRLVELSADIRSNAGTGGPGVRCDAISVGLEFDGVRAHLGGIAETAPVPRPCDSESP